MRTEQDKINRKEANQRYYKLEENKEQKREYMRKYNKLNRKTIYLRHEEWAQEMATEIMITYMPKTQESLQMTHKDKDLEKIYNDVFVDATRYMEDYEVQAVAATYMAIAMRLYKTHLADDDYKAMIETVMETEVKPYNPKKGLH